MDKRRAAPYFKSLKNAPIARFRGPGCHQIGSGMAKLPARRTHAKAVNHPGPRLAKPVHAFLATDKP